MRYRAEVRGKKLGVVVHTVAKTLAGAFVAVLLMAIPGASHAGDDHLRFSRAPSGGITAFLYGTVDPCMGSHIFPMGPASIVRSGNDFNISSFFAILDPPPCPSPAAPYEVSADLGVLPDGQYEVEWTVGPIFVRGAFKVVAGALLVLVEPIPALDVRALIALLAMVGAFGMFARRHRAHG